MDWLYSFVYRGVLTDESLDKAGRRRRQSFGRDDADKIARTLSLDLLDPDLLANSQLMAVVYTAIHAFENMVRQLVSKAMAEEHGEDWWAKVPDRVRKRAKTRMEQDAKFRYHGSRGATEVMYVDFGDLSSIIVTNWSVFEAVLTDMEWSKTVLNTLEMSRNVVMHGGVLAKEDIERVGLNIRDWLRQAGS